MAKEKTESPETIQFNLNGRGIADAGRIFRNQAVKMFGTGDFKTLDLGFELPERFLELGGPQPILAQLVVLANKLKMQINITHVELKAQEDIDAEKRTITK